MLNDVFSNIIACDNSTIRESEIEDSIVYHNFNHMKDVDLVLTPQITEPQQIYNIKWYRTDLLDEYEFFLIMNDCQAFVIYENSNDFTYGIAIRPWIENNELSKCEKIIKVVIMK
jgi:hypothetical protein